MLYKLPNTCIIWDGYKECDKMWENVIECGYLPSQQKEKIIF